MHFDKINDVIVIKKRFWDGYQTKAGAHYYAYSPYKTGYSKVTGDIILPYTLNTGNRNAYISFGVLGINGIVDIGIMNGGNGWRPCYYDVKNKDFHAFNEFAPSNTTRLVIVIDVYQNRKIDFYISFRNDNFDILKSFETQIDASHILEYEKNKVKNRFYRFASLVPKGIDDQNDGTYQFKSLFYKADKDKDGLISYQELKLLLENCGYPCSEAELQDYVNDVDINENGELNVDSFLDIIENIQKENDTEEELQEVFKIFDKNNTKLISPKNVLDIFSKIDETIKEEEVLQMFKECDLDNDGYLNYQEFKRMIRNK